MLQALQGVLGIVQTHNENASARGINNLTDDQGQIVPPSAEKGGYGSRKQTKISNPKTERQITLCKQQSVGSTMPTTTIDTSSYSATFNSVTGNQHHKAQKNGTGHQLE